MDNYTIEMYRKDSVLLRQGLKNKRPIYYIMKEYFPDYKGDRKRLRSEIQNCLNGNSYEKTLQMNLMPIFEKLYYIKTGNRFLRK